MRARLWVLIAVAALTVWLFGAALDGQRIFAFRDSGHYFPALFGFSAAEWRADRVPLWNPYEQIGLPALGENTASVFYPGQLLMVGPLRFFQGYNLYVVGHVILAAIGTYRFARQGGSSPLAAGLAALSYAFSGGVLFQYCNVIFLVGAAWLPFALAATDRLLRSRRWNDAIWLGLYWALMVLGGDPQMAFNAALLAAAYAIYLSWLDRGIAEASVASGTSQADRDAGPCATAGSSSSVGEGQASFTLLGESAVAHGKELASSIGRDTGSFSRLRQASGLRSRVALLAGAAALGFSLAAIQIFPTWELAALSPRARHDLPRTAWELAASAAQPGEASWAQRVEPLYNAAAGGRHLESTYEFSVGPWRWLELFWPNIGGRQFPLHQRWMSGLASEGRIWSPSLYCGAITLMLAFGGWRLRRGDPRLRGYGWMAIGAVLLALGEYGLGWAIELIGQSTGAWTGAFGVGHEFGGLYWLTNLIVPGYVAFRYPAKLWTLAALGTSLLAARGWDAAWAGERGAKAAAWRLGVLSALSLAFMGAVYLGNGALTQWLETIPADPLFGPFNVAGALNDVHLGLVQTALVCSIGALALMVAAPGTMPSITRWAPPLLLLLTAIDLAVAHRWLVPTVDARLAAAEPDKSDRDEPPGRIYRDAHWLPPVWSRTSSPDRLAEMFRWDHDSYWPKHHLPWRLGSIESSGMLVPDDYLAVWDVARAHGPVRPVDGTRMPHPSIVNMLGAGAVVMPADSPEIVDGPKDIIAGRPQGDAGRSEAAMQENLGAFPRAWIVHRVTMLPPLDDIRPSAVRERTEQVLFPGGTPRDWHEEAVVESATPLRFQPEALPPSSSDDQTSAIDDHINIMGYQPDYVFMEVTLVTPGVLVMSDLHYPGWVAIVDDHSSRSPVQVLRVNRVLRGVSLSAGNHYIEFFYRPASVGYGGMLSFIALVGLIMLLGFQLPMLHHRWLTFLKTAATAG